MNFEKSEQTRIHQNERGRGAGSTGRAGQRFVERKHRSKARELWNFSIGSRLSWCFSGKVQPASLSGEPRKEPEGHSAGGLLSDRSHLKDTTC